MSGYISRSSRWGWTEGGSADADLAEDTMVIDPGQAGQHAQRGGLAGAVRA